MCLSSVYSVNGDEKTLLCKNIATITMDRHKWVFTDIMGRKFEKDADIERINLTEGFIYINEKPLHEKSGQRDG